MKEKQKRKEGRDKRKEARKEERKERKEERKERGRTRPSRPIRYDMWIVERMRYRQTDRPTEGHSQL